MKEYKVTLMGEEPCASCGVTLEYGQEVTCYVTNSEELKLYCNKCTKNKCLRCLNHEHIVTQEPRIGES